MLSEFKAKQLPAIISGLMLTAAFPKLGISLLAWVALVPLFVVLRGQSAREAFRTGMIAGLAHYLTLLYWVMFTMHTYGYLPWWQCVSLLVLLAAYLALYPGVFAVLLTRLCKKPQYLVLLAPIFWVALEYVRGFLLTGFPWGILGYSQFNRLHIIQISDIFGVYGVSFLVVLFNAALYVGLLFMARKNWHGHGVNQWHALQAAALAVILVASSLAYGTARMGEIEKIAAKAPSARVGLVQGNIPEDRKWNPVFQISTTKKYIAMTLKAAARGADLVVWPETATPFYFDASPKLTRLVTDAVRKAGIHLLLGSPSVQAEGKKYAYYNSAYMLAPDGRATGRYDKVHLVPFGEYVPFKRVLFFVGKMVAQVGDFSAGEQGRTLSWGSDRPPIGVQICFEIIFPGLSRALVKNGAGLLVNITNDAWFGRSSAAYQDFSMAVFRAVENRRSLVRCANTGISGFVDPAGRISATTRLFKDAVEVRPVPILTMMSLYTRFGDVLPILCLIVAGVLIWRRMTQNLQERPETVVAAAIARLMDPMKQRLKQWVGRTADKRR